MNLNEIIEIKKKRHIKALELENRLKGLIDSYDADEFRSNTVLRDIRQTERWIADLKFEYPVYQCETCQDYIMSKYGGEFAMCKCYRQSREKCNGIFNKIKEAVGLDFLGEIHRAGTDKERFMENSMGHFVSCWLNEKHGTGIYVDSTPHYSRQGGDIDNSKYIGSDINELV